MKICNYSVIKDLWKENWLGNLTADSMINEQAGGGTAQCYKESEILSFNI